MPTFDFRRFHLRAIHAETREERTAINQELKTLYASLPDDEKAIFNEELQCFLTQQYKNIGSEYEALKQSGALE
jgi:hypothetical protein